MNRMFVPVVLVLFFIAYNARAQESLIEEKIQAFRAHNAKISSEKTYVHFETSGTDIWFNLYVFNGRYKLPTTISASTTVKLFDKSGQLLKQQVVKLTEGKAIGTFNLSADEFGKAHYIMSQTEWQKNTNTPATKFFIYSKNQESSGCEYLKLEPYLEQDSLITGVRQKLIVVSEQNVDSGQIELLSKGGEILVSAPIKKSFASLIIEPEMIGNSLSIRLKGCAKTFPLSQPVEKGLITQFRKLGASNYLLNIENRGLDIPDNRLVGVLQADGRILKRANISLTNNKARVVFSRDELVAGVSQITLLDINGYAIRSELLYIRESNAPDIRVSTEKDNLKIEFPELIDSNDLKYLSIAIRKDSSNFNGYTSTDYLNLLSDLDQPERIGINSGENQINETLLTQKWSGVDWNVLSPENDKIQDSIMDAEIRNAYLENIVYEEVNGDVRKLDDVTVTAEREDSEKADLKRYPSKQVTGKGNVTLNLVDDPFVNDNDSVLDILQSGVPGVRVLGDINSFMIPGGTEISIIIRGSSENAYIFLDNIVALTPNDLAQIRVSEIGSIEVFTGPEASRWGARGAYGVIALYSRVDSKKTFREYAREQSKEKVKKYQQSEEFETDKKSEDKDLLFFKSDLILDNNKAYEIRMNEAIKKEELVYLRIEALSSEGKPISRLIPIRIDQ